MAKRQTNHGPRHNPAASVAQPRRARRNRPTGLDADLLSPAERAGLADRLKARRAELGLDVATVAGRASITPGLLYRLERADQNNPEFKVLRALARALDLPLAILLGVANHVDLRMATAIPIIGQAEVGTYRTEKPQQSGMLPHAPPPLDPRFDTYDTFAVPVTDDHMEGLTPPVPRGHHALVIRLTGGEHDLESGRIYLVHRPNSEGQVETSFRRVTIYHDKYEFAIASRDPARNERNTITVTREAFGRTGIEIGGLFYAAICQYI